MKELKQFVDRMQATSSSLDKVEILKQQSKFIKRILEYTYNPYKQYNVTSKTCKKNAGLFKYNSYKRYLSTLTILTNSITLLVKHVRKIVTYVTQIIYTILYLNY